MRSWKRTIAVLMAATIVLVAAACGDDNNDSSSGSGATTTTAAGANVDYKSLSGTLNGSGSSFQDAFQQKAKTEFKTVAPDVTVNYTKSGSTAGKQDLANQVVQFAGTDSTIKPEQLPTFKGGTVLYFPIVGAPITVSYNVNGVDKLQLSGDTLAGIFSAQIKTWNDPKIVLGVLPRGRGRRRARGRRGAGDRAGGTLRRGGSSSRWSVGSRVFAPWWPTFTAQLAHTGTPWDDAHHAATPGSAGRRSRSAAPAGCAG